MEKAQTTESQSLKEVQYNVQQHVGCSVVKRVLTSWRCYKAHSQQARQRRGATSNTWWWTSHCYGPLGPTQHHEEDTVQSRSEASEQKQKELSHSTLESPTQTCAFLGIPARTSFPAAWWACSAASPLGCYLCGRPPGRQRLHFRRWHIEVAGVHERPALSFHGGGTGKESLAKSSLGGEDGAILSKKYKLCSQHS